MAGNLPLHPAPGLGDMLPGFYALPQNPITGGGGGGPVTVKLGIGEILPGSYSVPQNPITSFVTGNVRPIGTGPGMGCACEGQLNGQPVGMGDFSTDWSKFSTDLTGGSFGTALQDTIMGIPVWGVGAALLLATMFMGSGGRRRR